MTDSRHDTHEHVAQVRGLLLGAATDLLERAHRHDRSKLTDPELSIFNEYGPKLADVEYGSDEYKEHLAEMQVALDHHYARNDHHPEFHGKEGKDRDGDPLPSLKEMSLLSLTEMLCDWLAACRRHKDKPSDIHKSIDMNAARFHYGPEITRLLHNSAEDFLLHEVNVDDAAVYIPEPA